MGYRNIYQGHLSWYALKEGIYVPEKGWGVGLETGVSILYLLLRDLKRGWTYDHYGRKIPMTEDLFRRRARYLYALCIKHTGRGQECELLKKAIEYAIKHKRLPDWAKRFVRIARAIKVRVRPAAREAARRAAVAVAVARR